MPNKKQVFTWPLSLLVIIVSFLSVLLVLKEVQGTWLEPYYLPSDTSVSQNFVFTPLAEDLYLGSKKIVKTSQPGFVIDPGGAIGLSVSGSSYAGAFAGNVIVTGNLTVDGTINGGGGGGGTDHFHDWAINYAATANRALYYTTTSPASNGNVGIGTDNPSHRLHILASAENAEIDLQSGGAAGDNSHWGIYHDRGTDQLRFWKSAGNNVLTLAANGRVGIGTTPDPNNILKVSTAAVGVVGIYGENVNSGTWPMNQNNNGVKGVAINTLVGGIGVYGFGYNGVKGLGTYGVYGESDGGSGAGVYGKKGTGSHAAYFDGFTEIMGDLKVNGNVQIAGPGKYFFISNGAGAPSTPCILGSQGATYFDLTNNRLYICSTPAIGWRYITLDNS